MLDILRTYWKAYKAQEPFAADLEEFGMTDLPEYREFEDYRDGYELARAELLESLGIEVRDL